MENKNEITYKNNKLPQNAFQCFEDMRRRREFCDVTFKVGDYSVSAHRIVILTAMPRFREVFSSELTQSKNVSVPEVEPCVFDSLIDYAYTSTIKINTENVKLLLSGACRLGVKEVRKACCEFIAYDGLHPQNVLQFLDLGKSLDCCELIRICENYVRENFSGVSQTEEFLKLDSSFVKDVIASDELVVVSEEKVYEAAIRWTKYSPEERKVHLPCLLKCVRMPLLDTLYLRKVVGREELIRRSIECRDLLDEAKDYHYEPNERDGSHTFSTQLRSYHPCQRCEEFDIYALSGEFSLKAQYPDPDYGQWMEKKKEIFMMYGDNSSSVTLHDKIYFFSWENTWCFNPLESDIKSTSRSVQGRAVAVLNNKLYVCGGSDGYSTTNTVQCFDPLLEEWNEINCMRQRRKFASATTLGESIYVLGGESNEGVLKSVEKYSSGIQMWISVPDMLTHRKKFSSAALNGKLYACGGITTGSTKCVSTAEVYEPIIKQWKHISSLKSARCEFSLINCQGKLHAIGGKNDSRKEIATVEIWNSDSDTWSAGITLPVGPSGYYISGASTVKRAAKGN